MKEYALLDLYRKMRAVDGRNERTWNSQKYLNYDKEIELEECSRLARRLFGEKKEPVMDELTSLGKRLADYCRMTIETGGLKPDSPIGIAYRDFIEEWNKCQNTT